MQHMVLLAAVAGQSLFAASAAAQSASPAIEAKVDDSQSDVDGTEIVVTAQRRAERLENVPISIVSLKGDDLVASGVDSSLALATKVPGMIMPLSGGVGQPNIRGISTNSNSPGIENGVAIYVDGVYITSQAAAPFEFNNIAQIDVMKGPQGTLFGRNAVGGAISVTTIAPTQDAYGRFSASFGSFEEVKLNGLVNGGIAPGLAANVAVLYKRDDGYAKFITGEGVAKANTKAVRAKIGWDLGDALSVTLSGDYSDSSDNAGYSMIALDGRSSLGARARYSDDPRLIILTAIPEFKVKDWGVSLRGAYTGDAGTLTITSAYRSTYYRYLTDADRTDVPVILSAVRNRNKTITQEINFSSRERGGLSWTAGAFLFADKSGIPELTVNGAFFLNSEVRTNAYAAYGEATLRLGERLFLTGGARYSYEKKRYSVRSATASATDQNDWSALTPRAVVRYQLNPQSNVYASYSRGFKSGAYNASAFAPMPVDQETVDGFEVGYKRNSRAIRFNASAFYYNYKDLQITRANGFQTALLNAAAVRSYGLDADLTYRVVGSDVLTLDARLGGAWTHARYTNFPNAITFTPLPAGGNRQGVGDVSGNEVARTPKYTVTAGFNLTRRYSSGELNLVGDFYYNDGFYWEVGNRLREDSYVVLNASIGWRPANSPLEFRFWTRNLTDSTYGLYGQDSTFADAKSYARPRSVGVTLNVDLR